jgi:hypothetical protein
MSSFLGSDQERIAIEALPRFIVKNHGRIPTAGRACVAVRYRAEPGNERAQTLAPSWDSPSEGPTSLPFALTPTLSQRERENAHT